MEIRPALLAPPLTPIFFSAVVWGASAKHARGQKVGLDHVLEDEDGTSFIFDFNNSANPYDFILSGAHFEEVM